MEESFYRFYGASQRARIAISCGSYRQIRILVSLAQPFWLLPGARQ